MIEVILLAMLQSAPSDRIAFVCQDDKGQSFSAYVPLVVEEDESPDPARYSVEGLNIDGVPDEVFDELPEDLELNWRPNGAPQVRLEISDYDVVGRTAAYRLHRESPPGQAISWSSFSAGQCLGRRIGGDAPQEGRNE